MLRFPLCLEKTSPSISGDLTKRSSLGLARIIYMQHNQDIHEVSIHICLFGHMTLASDKYITFRPQARSALILRPPPLGQQEKKQKQEGEEEKAGGDSERISHNPLPLDPVFSWSQESQ